MIMTEKMVNRFEDWLKSEYVKTSSNMDKFKAYTKIEKGRYKSDAVNNLWCAFVRGYNYAKEQT